MLKKENKQFIEYYKTEKNIIPPIRKFFGWSKLINQYEKSKFYFNKAKTENQTVITEERNFYLFGIKILNKLVSSKTQTNQKIKWNDE